MKVKCDYCDNYIDETDEQCPYCGAPNEHMTRSGTGVPKTIAELLAFAQQRNIPLEKMRFFIGQNCQEPRCFGIYQDDEGNFVVYKNKSDGSRAIRYRGEDEAYAVNEIYQKMRAEVLERKQAKGAPSGSGGSGKSSKGARGLLIFQAVMIFGVAALIIFAIFAFISDSGKSGYYRYNDDYYYYDGGWYSYNDSYGWERDYNVPETLDSNYNDYYQGNSYSDVSDSGVEQYVSTTSDSDWDSDDWDDDDWSWTDWDDDDGGGWDSYSSSDTDWDSDW